MKKTLIFALVFLSILLVACPREAAPATPPAPEDPSAPVQPVKEEITASVSITSAPASVEEGKEFSVTWKVESDKPATIGHTAVHHGTKSVPGTLEGVAPPDSGYPSFTSDFASKESAIPGVFTAKIKAPAGTLLYIRAHAIVDGKQIWGAERSVRILKAAVSPTQSAAPPLQEVVEADDNGFYPAKISIKKGTKLTILFKVKSVGVYYGGLDFRSSKFNSPSIAPGGSWGTPEFTADGSFIIGSYWPASGVHKADFTVEVTQ